MPSLTKQMLPSSLGARRDALTSPAERAVLDYLLSVGPRAAAMSAQQIANGAGTSDATVVRAAKSLGYPNLRELRLALAEERGEADLPTRLRATLEQSSGGHDVLGAAVERQLGALDALVRRIAPPDFEHAVHALAKAPRVWWSGIGPSSFLAGYAAFLCNRLGTPAGAFTHAGTDHADELVSLQRGDTVVVLAYGRIYPHVSVLLDHAASVGARVILMTDTAYPRVAGTEMIRLQAGRGAPGLFATHGATIVLIEALVLAAAAEDPDRSAETLETLNELRAELAGRRVDVDP
jgi:DNA-binding MurR/RpiR family transcriptional regulator